MYVCVCVRTHVYVKLRLVYAPAAYFLTFHLAPPSCFSCFHILILHVGESIPLWHSPQVCCSTAKWGGKGSPPLDSLCYSPRSKNQPRSYSRHSGVLSPDLFLSLGRVQCSDQKLWSELKGQHMTALSLQASRARPARVWLIQHLAKYKLMLHRGTVGMEVLDLQHPMLAREGLEHPGIHFPDGQDRKSYWNLVAALALEIE